LPAQSRPLLECIGQTLREDIFAERENPPFDRVCMDGIAIASARFEEGQRRFRIEATQAAGAPALRLADASNAIEVMTGAVVPSGTDCIIPLEEYELASDVVTLKPNATGKSSRNIQRRGEDSEKGIAMLKAGVRLGGPELAVAASAGLARLSVTRAPRIVAISTGDELVEPGEPILEHQVRRSNAYAIVGALRRRGYDKVVDDHIRDQEQLLRDRLTKHLAEQDVLVLSGGVSKGRFDLVPKALEQVGVSQVFYQVAQRPGMPMYFGTGPAGQLVFGLPGNPVSTLMCLIRYVAPALSHLSGLGSPPMQRMPIASAISFGRPFTYFVPVSVRVDDQGAPSAAPAPANGPGDFLALTKTNGFIELPPQAEPFAVGFVAGFYPW
jgi:molybdopterin molybdotransferase